MIAAGGFHTWVVDASGSMSCWGWSNFGLLGNGTRGIAEPPMAVAGMDTGVTSIAAGEGTSCAVKNGNARTRATPGLSSAVFGGGERTEREDRALHAAFGRRHRFRQAHRRPFPSE